MYVCVRERVCACVSERERQRETERERGSERGSESESKREREIAHESGCRARK